MLSPDLIAQQFNALPESEKLEIAETMTPRMAELLTKMFGPEYQGILQRLDNYKSRKTSEGVIGGPRLPPRPVSGLNRVRA